MSADRGCFCLGGHGHVSMAFARRSCGPKARPSSDNSNLTCEPGSGAKRPSILLIIRSSCRVRHSCHPRTQTYHDEDRGDRLVRRQMRENPSWWRELPALTRTHMLLRGTVSGVEGGTGTEKCAHPTSVHHGSRVAIRQELSCVREMSFRYRALRCTW